MKLVVSCNELRYGGRTYLKGEPFETVSERDGTVLKLIKKAVDAPVTPLATPRPVQTVEPRALQPETPQSAPLPATEAPVVTEAPAANEAPAAAGAQPRRTYRRRDLTAEG